MKKKFPAVLMMLHVLVLGVLIPTYLLIDRKNAVLNALILSVVALILICVIYTIIYSKNSMRRISKMNQHLESSAAEFMNSLPAPVAVIDESRQFVWYNQIFAEKIGLGQDVYGLELEGFVKIDMNMLLKDGSAICPMNGSIYNVTAEKFDKNDMSFLVLYFHDDTSYYTVKKRMDESRPNVVIINIDNYDDIMQNAKESEKAQASVETEKLIEQFMNGHNGIIKKISSNTFYAVIETKHLDQLIMEKFSILDSARSITIASKYQLTFSIGVGQGASTLAESEEIARQCLDMALGRGGDQAVVKTDSGYRFFGGVSKGVEKKSKAKTRIISNALQDIIASSGRVFLMGHRFGDLDSVGASCGLAGAVKMLGIDVRIAVDRSKNLAVNLIEHVEKKMGTGVFIPPSEAVSMINPDDLLIIVDTHNKNLIESRELYEKAKSVVVIDHHRKTVNFIDDAVIFHHEPYASSACEMVTEIIEYFRFDNNAKLDPWFAEALLSGIMLDTKNFVMRTGVRTFEAAAFLRKNGADTVAVKQLFSNSFESYKHKTKIVSSAKIHGNCAVAAADFKSDDIRTAAPQAADELLGITGVDASFVVFATGNTANISARSLGAVNVQLIMEKLGGGGHQTMAATQLENTTVQEAVKQLISAIDERETEMLENG
ncbi:MAG: DHH family phosphoesterase [Ruminococcus sp.]|nr:DHH family phosphoesterase [Ruminococcus sp.]